ncbi:Fe(3+) ions import ATP-binding protein FbpC [Terrabacter tumescens]|uniref:Fe(3+) ions import ATP-binding protein FbpC n=1 Tax=Terrabacter tumescens TaxID=60443 RepID=A0ABQ2I034_9MICO|nr:ABC transporter ATP-binding protein [Terrabacter tumescens]GGM93918.1 Fe(3+) ions import ATP-binding protein FbpC [Terrabacter tumescens]
MTTTTTTIPDQHDPGARGRLEVDGLVKSFGSQQVLRGVTLSVDPGSTTAIVGPSGSGKTTLLRLIAGFERAEAGSVVLSGRTLAAGDAWVPAHHRGVGYVAQDGALFPHLTVGQNIAFGIDTPRLQGRKATRAKVAELLEMVSLDAALAARRPHEISGGQQQRVALARALAREPELMLLDESFSALDAGLRVATRRTVSRVLQDAGITTVLVTHDQAEALSFADQVAVMRDGLLAQVDSPLEVYTRPVDRATAEFLGDAVMLEAWVDGDMATCSLGAVRLAPTAHRGRVQLMLRPEQIRVDEHGPIRGVVVDTDYFGPESTVRLELTSGREPGCETSALARSGEIISIRHSNAFIAARGTELRLRIEGEAIAFPPDA